MWQLAEKKLNSRLILGSAQYPSLQIMKEAILAAESEILTVSIRRQCANIEAGNSFWQYLKTLNVLVLPNTAGCRNAQEAFTCAQMARELFNTHWIKLEIFGDDYSLQPDPFELLRGAELLIKNGFEVFPYCTEDLVLCKKLRDLGCRILMPWASPIGSGKGILNRYALEVLRERLSDVTLIIDAGIGKPSHATQVMELGFDGVLINSAIARAHEPVLMATAFKNAVDAGYLAYQAGMIPESRIARPSTLLLDTPFWHQVGG